MSRQTNQIRWQSSRPSNPRRRQLACGFSSETECGGQLDSASCFGAADFDSTVGSGLRQVDGTALRPHSWTSRPSARARWVRLLRAVCGICQERLAMGRKKIFALARLTRPTCMDDNRLTLRSAGRAEWAFHGMAGVARRALRRKRFWSTTPGEPVTSRGRKWRRSHPRQDVAMSGLRGDRRRGSSAGRSVRMTLSLCSPCTSSMPASSLVRSKRGSGKRPSDDSVPRAALACRQPRQG
jgi:hypothetical protein